jgi:hypothetical protein
VIAHVNVFYLLRILAFNLGCSERIVGDEQSFTSSVLYKLLENSPCYRHLNFHSANDCVEALDELTPSKVDVPRPSSSSMTRLLDEAVYRISLVSDISTINVERPLARSSEANHQ